MKKGIVVTFPGGRGAEIPLLYFGSKHFEDMGYEKLFISHSMLNNPVFDNVYENALNTLKNIKWEEYEQIVFIAKSLGTVVACKIKDLLNIPAALILFTPLEETLAYINRENNILLVAMGDEDVWLSSTILSKQCEDNGIKCHIEHGVGHRMEVKNELQRNLEIVYNVLRYIGK